MAILWKKKMQFKETLEDKIWSTYQKLQFITIVCFSDKIQSFEKRKKEE